MTTPVLLTQVCGPFRQIAIATCWCGPHARCHEVAETHSAFAVEAGLAALRWLVRGHGYEITSADVRAAYTHTIKAAANAPAADRIRSRIRALIENANARDDDHWTGRGTAMTRGHHGASTV